MKNDKKIKLTVFYIIIIFVISMIIWGLIAKDSKLKVEPVRNIYSVLQNGKWGWAIPESDLACENNPHSIKFRNNFTEIILKFDNKINSADATVSDTVQYKLISKNGNRITMKMVGEKRIDDKGQPVIWDLVMLNKQEYAWHRHDWKPGALTPRIHLCGTK